MLSVTGPRLGCHRVPLGVLTRRYGARLLATAGPNVEILTCV